MKITLDLSKLVEEGRLSPAEAARLTAVLAAAACLGAHTGYSHALYSLAICQPTLTIVLFAGFALLMSPDIDAGAGRLRAHRDSGGAHRRSARQFRVLGRLAMGRPAGAAARSQWRRRHTDRGIIPDYAFSIGWAVALIGAGAWAARANRRWLVNIAAVFAAIHFYTQWFERLGATPLSVLLGGMAMLAIAVALWAFNRQAAAAAPA